MATRPGWVCCDAHARATRAVVVVIVEMEGERQVLHLCADHYEEFGRLVTPWWQAATAAV